MAWSIDNPVVGEFEDLPVQPLPYRMTFMPAEPPSVAESTPSHAPADVAPTPSAAPTGIVTNGSLPTRWSPDNPVVGEFEDLIPQPLPYRTTFVFVDPPTEPIAVTPPSESQLVAGTTVTLDMPSAGEPIDATCGTIPANCTSSINSVRSTNLSPAGASLTEPDTSVSGGARQSTDLSCLFLPVAACYLPDLFGSGRLIEQKIEVLPVICLFIRQNRQTVFAGFLSEFDRRFSFRRRDRGLPDPMSF